MELTDATAARKSIRRFTKEMVPRKELERILSIAAQSPSALNTQPWEAYVVTGEPLAKIKEGNVKALIEGTMPAPESQSMENLSGVHKKRQVELAVALFKLMEIGRDDHEKRFDWMQRGFRYFDAPAAVIVGYDISLDQSANMYCDLGAFIHTFCLAATEQGLGTCIHSQGVMYPDIVRQHISIPEGKKIFIAVSIGYPDPDFPANQIESDREPVEKFTSWYGFE